MRFVRQFRSATPVALRFIIAVLTLSAACITLTGCETIAKYYHGTAGDISGAAGGAATVGGERHQRIHEENEIIDSTAHAAGSPGMPR